jgi:hypothetical protein
MHLVVKSVENWIEPEKSSPLAGPRARLCPQRFRLIRFVKSDSGLHLGSS